MFGLVIESSVFFELSHFHVYFFGGNWGEQYWRIIDEGLLRYCLTMRRLKIKVEHVTDPRNHEDWSVRNFV